MLILTVISCKKDTTTNIESDPYVCIDIHSQPAYPELGNDVDLPAILNEVAANSVSHSILSARVLMRYSTEIADFAQANPDRIMAAVSLKLSCMDTDTGFVNTLARQVATGKFKAITELLIYHAEKFEDGVSVAPEVRIDPFDPKVQAVMDQCAFLNCPVIFHIEFESLEANFGLTVRTQFMNKLKQILAGNPDQQFILTHVAELDPAECLLPGYGIYTG